MKSIKLNRSFCLHNATSSLRQCSWNFGTNQPESVPNLQKSPQIKPQKSVGGAGIKVFDRNLKMLQRDRSASSFGEFEYLRSEVAYRLSDRIYDVKRFFDVAVDLGCGTGFLAPNIFKENVGTFIQCDLSRKMIEMAKKSDEVATCSLVADEETAPAMFKSGSIDLAVSCLSMHWINNLPEFLCNVNHMLKPDGAFIGAMFGGQTLFELRCSLQLAEMERLGGISAHISPFTEVSDIGSLLHRAGFRMLTMDIDEFRPKFSNIYRLMYDLQGMAENSCSFQRAKLLKRDVLDSAAAIYKEMYADEDGLLPATFQVINMIGWKDSPKMAQPAKRGSANVSLKDIGKMVPSTH